MIKKHLVVLGMNHVCGDSALRNDILFHGNKACEGLNALLELDTILESVILSTCNRIEIYATVRNPDEAENMLTDFILDFHDIKDSGLYSDTFYFYKCGKAVNHLYNVVSSLNSMVIGEYQVLGQIKDAYKQALENGNTSAMLNKLFHYAIETGKKVRCQTNIGKGQLSVASVAIDFVVKRLPSLNTRKTLVIGAGKISKVTSEYLTKFDINQIYFINRTFSKARELAVKFEGIPVDFNKLSDTMSDCDIVISSTSAPHPIITERMVEGIMKKRQGKELFLIDLATPYDIMTEVKKIDNVHLWNIDDINNIVNHNLNNRFREIVKVESIIQVDMNKYFNWYDNVYQSQNGNAARG